jgi:hypothetical protein
MNSFWLKLLFITACVVALLNDRPVSADTFGNGADTFDIEFVSIGNPGNTADRTGDPNPAGSVPYLYRMGKFEISEDMINKANTLGSLGLTHNNRGANKPATDITWIEATKFVNWLNTSRGHMPAYKFDGSGNFQLWASGDAGYNANNPYRNSLAGYFLPSVHEWYKAAYYAPTSGIYYDFPTGSNTLPIPVASGMALGTAVYDGQPDVADVTLAGGLSPFGTMGQGGNVWEFEETDLDLVNDSTSSLRGIRGGRWDGTPETLSATLRIGADASGGAFDIGFRVASIPVPIPEPSIIVLAALGSLSLICFATRRIATRRGPWTTSVPRPECRANSDLARSSVP